MTSIELLTAVGKYAALFVTVVAGSWLGAYIGSYLKKKGENLAIHEDIDKLIKQMAAVTQTTKEIEAKISDEVWDRQKLWEMKRQVLFEAAKRITEADNALTGLHALYISEPKLDDPNWAKAISETHKRWIDAHAALDTTRMLVGIVCGKEVTMAIDSFGDLTGGIAGGLARKDAEVYGKSRRDLLKSHIRVMAAIRRELGIAEPAQIGLADGATKTPL
ncbi:MAG TPA: hypothetical protein VKV95_14430 [Terriglobia bacterium]|nr:hypothetical protein [Terriglobia bacterium]